MGKPAGMLPKNKKSNGRLEQLLPRQAKPFKIIHPLAAIAILFIYLPHVFYPLKNHQLPDTAVNDAGHSPAALPVQQKARPEEMVPGFICGPVLYVYQSISGRHTYALVGMACHPHQ